MNTETQIPPFPVALVYRRGNPCRQYPFDTLEALQAWTARKPYSAERLLVVPIHGGQFLPKQVVPAGEAVAYVNKMVAEANAIAPGSDS